LANVHFQPGPRPMRAMPPPAKNSYKFIVRVLFPRR
jgi:hypothetical protein